MLPKWKGLAKPNQTPELNWTCTVTIPPTNQKMLKAISTEGQLEAYNE